MNSDTNMIEKVNLYQKSIEIDINQYFQDESTFLIFKLTLIDLLIEITSKGTDFNWKEIEITSKSQFHLDRQLGIGFES